MAAASNSFISKKFHKNSTKPHKLIIYAAFLCTAPSPCRRSMPLHGAQTYIIYMILTNSQFS